MINFPTMCIDGFYSQPDKVREFALTQHYEDTPGNYPGRRTKGIHLLSPELFQLFSSKLMSIYYPTNQLQYNITTSFWKSNTIDPIMNSPKNMGWIHEDKCLFAGVIYLDPAIDSRLGTTIYKMKEPYEVDEDDLTNMRNFYSNGIEDGFTNSLTKNNSHYVETARFDNVYNRLVSFDGQVSHSPSHYYMGKATRLVQVFFVNSIDCDIEYPLSRIKSFGREL